MATRNRTGSLDLRGPESATGCTVCAERRAESTAGRCPGGQAAGTAKRPRRPAAGGPQPAVRSCPGRRPWWTATVAAAQSLGGIAAGRSLNSGRLID